MELTEIIREALELPKKDKMRLVSVVLESTSNKTTGFRVPDLITKCL